MIVEVRHLRMLDAIRREGGVTKASRVLHLTQPAVSHALRDLERRLGVELFHRRGRGMVPTREGERLLRAAEVVLAEVERAEYDVQQLRSGRQGVVRLATQCYTCYHWLPRILAAFAEELPGIDLQIVPDATDRAEEALLAEEIDLAVVHLRSRRPELVAHELFTDELVAVFAPDHPLAGRERVEPEDFSDQHLLLHSDPDGSVAVADFLRPAGVRPRQVSELRLTEAVLSTVEAGLGVSMLARWVVAPELESGRLAAARLGEAGVERRWYAQLLERRDDHPPLRRLVELLRRDAFTATEACGVLAGGA